MNSRRCFVLVTLLLAITAGADEPRPPTTSSSVVEYPADEIVRERQQEQQAAEATLLDLRERHQVQFVDVPLTDAAQQLSKLTGIRFHIDVPSLHEEGIAEDTPITRRTRQPQRMTDLLNRMLQPLQLSWQIEGNSVRITTFTKVRNLAESRTYLVGRLLRLAVERDKLLPKPPSDSGSPAAPREAIAAVGQLLELRIPEVAPDLWLTSSGTPRAGPRVIGERMLVHQTPQAHREIAALLRSVELALARPLRHSPQRATETENESLDLTKQQRLLNTEIELDFTDQPLSDVVAWFSEQLDDDVDIDTEALTEEGIATDSPVTVQGRWPARIAMQLILDPMQLTIGLNHGVIQITTKARAHDRLQAVVYDVADFLQAGVTIDDLDRIIVNSTSGPWQPRGSEARTITEFPGGLLVIRQRADVQTEVAVLLLDLRQALSNDKMPPRADSSKLVTRFHRTNSKAEAESLERLLMTFVAPATWDSSGGPGVLRIAEDRLVIRQTNVVHEQIDRFLRAYQQATPIGPAAK